MDLEALQRPLSDELPCGADLFADQDPEYDEYYFESQGRLPTFYMQPGVDRPDGTRTPDRLFDPKEVDLRAENEAIDSLFERSRDIRLLTLRAQWEILAGRLGQMAQSVEAIATLLENFPEEAHPTLADGPADRRDALSELNLPITVIQPLMFAGLTGSSEVTLRKIRVANGLATPLADEQDLTPGLLSDALGAPINRSNVDTTHGALLTLLSAVARIETACKTHPQSPFSPNFEDLRKILTEMMEAITSARADLRGADIPTPEPAEEPAAESHELRLPPGAAPAAKTANGAEVTEAYEVSSHPHARQLLEACERYFHQNEPSSAALLLVTQARMLIGKSLVEALQTLLPQQCGGAIVDFGPQTGFALDAERLVQLTDAVAGSDGPMPEQEVAHAAIQDRPIPSSEAAVAAIRSVEGYFRSCERSSPVPLLLQRARSYIGKDFQSLVEELIPGAQNGH